MGTEEAVGVPVAALAEQVQIEVLELRTEAVGVVPCVAVALLVVPVQTVVLRHFGRIALPLEQVRAFNPAQVDSGPLDADALGLWQKGFDQATPFCHMPAEDCEGIVMARFEDAPDGLGELYVLGFPGVHGDSTSCAIAKGTGIGGLCD